MPPGIWPIKLWRLHEYEILYSCFSGPSKFCIPHIAQTTLNYFSFLIFFKFNIFSLKINLILCYISLHSNINLWPWIEKFLLEDIPFTFNNFIERSFNSPYWSVQFDGFSVITELHNHNHILVLEHLYHSQKKSASNW